MVNRNRQISAVIAVVFILAGAAHFWCFWNQDKLPPTAQVLTDAQMKHILGSHGELIQEQIKCLCCECCNYDPGYYMPISATNGTVYTDVPICQVYSAEGATIDFRLHYDSGKADGTIARRRTVSGYGWTHNYNIYLIVRSLDVFMPDGTGKLTRFRKRLDGGYTPSDGVTDGLISIDPNTFIINRTDGTELTFKLIGPSPWPTSGTMYPLYRIEDGQGNAAAFSYNEDGLLDSITDPYERKVSLTYNENGRLDSITNADGAVTQIEYKDDDDDLWKITDPLGNTLEYTYDSQNRMTAEKLKDGNTWTCVYNAQGKPYQLIDDDGQVYSTVTNPLNWAIDLDHMLQFDEARYIPGTTTVTDGEGNDTYYDYDENACIYRIYYPDGTEQICEFDDELRPETITDEEGNQTQYEYDENGNITKTTDPLGNETQMSYEHSSIPSLMTKRVEPDGNIWEYEYDADGNLTKEIDPIVESPNDAVIVHTYDANGHRISTTDRNGHLTKWEYNPNGTLARWIIDPCGLNIVREYQYNAAGRLTRKTTYRGTALTDPVTTKYDYDSMGRFTKEAVDPCGLNLITEYEYDEAGRIVEQINPRGVHTCYEYDIRGRLVKEIIDPCGLNLTNKYEYDRSGNNTKVIDPKGNETNYEYDNRGRLVKTVDAANYWTLYEYDKRGNAIRESRSIDPCGPPYRVTESRYDELSRRTHEIIDPYGLNLTTTFEYAPPGGGGCSCSGTPGSSLVHKETDPAGKVTYYYYDSLDRQTKVVHKVSDLDDNGGDADDGVICYEYDYTGNQTRIIVENEPYPEPVTTYEYDAADRLIKQVLGPNDANLVTTHSYDCAGNVIQETTPTGNRITSVYDRANRLATESDLKGLIAAYTYDENGNLLTQTDGLGHTWTYTYDNIGRQLTAKDPLIETPADKYTINEYDDNDNLIRVTDNEELVTTYTYDGLDKRIELIYDPCGLDINVKFTYDGLSNLIQITDDNGNNTNSEYDAANRKVREIYTDGTDILFEYDPSGNIITMTDQMGNITAYTYDELNRLILRSYANGQTESFTYDQAGQMLSADNNHSHIGRVYDDVGRISSETQANIPQTYSYTVFYDYNVAAKTRTITYPSGKVVLEVSDFRNRLIEVWQDGIKTTWYTYDDPGNRIITKSFANGTHTEYAYNDNDWITELRHIDANGTSTFAGFAYEYDAVGNRLNARNLQNVLTYDDAKPVTQSEKYEYDSMYRLIDFKRGQLIGSDIPSPARHRTWQIDGVQNWTGFSIDGKEYVNSINHMNEYDDPSNDGPPPVPDDDGFPDDFMADVNILTADLSGDAEITFNDLAIFASHWLEESCSEPDFCGGADLNQNGIVDLSDLDKFIALWLKEAGYNFAHDKNGNLDNDGLREYYYDYQTNISSPVRSKNQLTMVKDKATDNVLGQYWYDALGRRIRKSANGINTIYVYDGWRVIAEYENGSPARSYDYGSSIDEILTMDNFSGQRYYYHTDALDSIDAITVADSDVVERYSYDAYGQPYFSDSSGNEISQSAIGNPYLFTAREYDDKSSLYYYRTRYLHSKLGRFTSRDTIGIWGDNINLGSGYSYVGNNPRTASDPFGLVKYTTIYIPSSKSYMQYHYAPLNETKECSGINPPAEPGKKRCYCWKECWSNYEQKVASWREYWVDEYTINETLIRYRINRKIICDYVGFVSKGFAVQQEASFLATGAGIVSESMSKYLTSVSAGVTVFCYTADILDLAGFTVEKIYRGTKVLEVPGSHKDYVERWSSRTWIEVVDCPESQGGSSPK